ncbi:MAG: ribosomal protein L7/L12 [Fuerstiella sp.]
MTDSKLAPEVIHEITDALAAAQKIQAIKIYRDATGKGLKEAKQFIDELTPQLIEQDPERFAKLQRAKAGCGSAVLIFALLGTAVAVAIS